MTTNERIDTIQKLAHKLDHVDQSMLFHATLGAMKGMALGKVSAKAVLEAIEAETADMSIRRRLQVDSPRFSLTNGQQDEYEQSLAAELAGDRDKADSLWKAILNMEPIKPSETRLAEAKKAFGNLVEAQGSFDIRRQGYTMTAGKGTGPYTAVDTTTGEAIVVGDSCGKVREAARKHYREKLKASKKPAAQKNRAREQVATASARVVKMSAKAGKGTPVKKVTHSGHKFQIYDRGEKAAGASVRFCAENSKGETVASGADLEICRDMLHLYAKELDEPQATLTKISDRRLDPSKPILPQLAEKPKNDCLTCPKCQLVAMNRAFPNNTVFVCDACGHIDDFPETRTLKDEVKFHLRNVREQIASSDYVTRDFGDALEFAAELIDTYMDGGALDEAENLRQAEADEDREEVRLGTTEPTLLETATAISAGMATYVEEQGIGHDVAAETAISMATCLRNAVRARKDD